MGEAIIVATELKYCRSSSRLQQCSLSYIVAKQEEHLFIPTEIATVSESQNSLEKLRTIAEGFEEISGLSKKQALAYTFRSIGGMDRQDTVMQMDAKPSTVDTHFQRAKQKIRNSRALTYYVDIYQGNTSNLREEGLTFEGETREGTKLPVVPDQWEETPFEYEEEGVTVRVFQLPDNRFAKCINRSDGREFIEVKDLGFLNIKTADFDPSGFEDYFREEFGIDLSLDKETYISLANDYKTMVETAVFGCLCFGRACTN